MCKVVVSIVTMGMAAISLANPAHAGNGSAVGAGLLGFGVGALVGSAVTPQTVYVAPSPPVHYAPSPPVYGAPAPTLGRCTMAIRNIEPIAASVMTVGLGLAA